MDVDEDFRRRGSGLVVDEDFRRRGSGLDIDEDFKRRGSGLEEWLQVFTGRWWTWWLAVETADGLTEGGGGRLVTKGCRPVSRRGQEAKALAEVVCRPTGRRLGCKLARTADWQGEGMQVWGWRAGGRLALDADRRLGGDAGYRSTGEDGRLVRCRVAVVCREEARCRGRWCRPAGRRQGVGAMMVQGAVLQASREEARCRVFSWKAGVVGDRMRCRLEGDGLEMVAQHVEG